ncbi:CTP:phosphocholine cytidylyltransferase involved in choline phosphorylation for cell surface LPS epitopes [Yersinia intermedia]|uniref:CTP:phosphocholine cytidylyltransferase involved in choline phosphorylation for cell surface LPS epitopes n=1 Tax=Yersinia intermedia TaxID=631 RepID=A0A0H5LWP4_YERIN|nr:sugar phosphate nucleotidyltransferase [Yersinia intermedia]CRY55553.1 CTP:phosphocholine cytidylyltransferase involved in choline phosphorylation for cell surface LPS epitopes [Yersinia intermedia]
MSGFGERFRRAGYKMPKPLIEIDGKPIISHVVDMFPGEKDFIFICNQDHLDNPDYNMEAILHRYCPTGKVIGIPAHKLGPIHAVRQVEHMLDPQEPVVVNYCDFTCYWDWHHFKEFVCTTACTGAIPAYKGFHPHTLGSTNYAYIKEHNGRISDIQEKQPYTDNRMEEYASSGTYYFSSAKIMSEAFRRTIDQQLNIGGEYYVSLAYKPLLADKKPIVVYPIQHFMQWGTPDDVAEYNGWSSTFRQLIKPDNSRAEPAGSLIIPMAGLGQRFVNEGYSITKPLIPVSGKPMVTQAINDLPPALQYAFVLRSDMSSYNEIGEELQQLYPNSVIETIAGVTEGQACTALIGLDALERSSHAVAGPITIGTCDNGALYNASAFKALTDNPEIDVIVWGARGHANAIRHPNMFGWINANEQGKISDISVKVPFDSPEKDPIVTGTFTFRRAEDFRKVVSHLIGRNGRVNGEFYLDSCINDAIALGLNCHLFEVDHYISWGTPNDLRTFEYWQSCFHKWKTHPYRLQLDSRVPAEALPHLEFVMRDSVPEIPRD